MADGLLQLSFRQRLANLASEHEQLQVRCETLAAENNELRARLLKLEEVSSSWPAIAEGEQHQPKLPPPSAPIHCRRAPSHGPDGFSGLEERAEHLLAFLKSQPTEHDRDKPDDGDDDQAEHSYDSASCASWGDEASTGRSSRSSSHPRRHSPCSLRPSTRAIESSRARSRSRKCSASITNHKSGEVKLTSPKASGSSRAWKRSGSNIRADARKLSPAARAPLRQSGTGELAQVNKAELVQGNSQKNGEPTWQAHILVPQITGGTNYAGRIRTFTVRCPVRLSEEQAREDAKQLEEAAPKGPQAVRAVANELQRTKTSSDQHK